MHYKTSSTMHYETSATMLYYRLLADAMSLTVQSLTVRVYVLVFDFSVPVSVVGHMSNLSQSSLSPSLGIQSRNTGSQQTSSWTPYLCLAMQRTGNAVAMPVPVHSVRLQPHRALLPCSVRVTRWPCPLHSHAAYG